MLAQLQLLYWSEIRGKTNMLCAFKLAELWADGNSLIIQKQFNT